MIVADVTSFFSSSAGGIRTYYQAKARWLPRLGVECHFVVPGGQASTERFGDGWLHRVSGPSLDAHYRCFADLPALWRVLGEIKPDLVELGSHYLLPQLLAPALRGRRAAVVGFYHADFPATYVEPALRRAPPAVRRAGRAAAWWLVRRQHAGYQATLAGSRQIAGRLTARGVPRVRWVGLGVDVGVFRPRWRDGALRLGYLGRLASDKELGVLLDAAPEITRRSGARIAIAGDGPMAGAVAAAVARGDVDAVGLLDGAEDAADFLGGLDALVMPGRHESFGLAAAEAMACATPVIGADRGGAGELVARSGAGVTFAAGSAASLADAAVGLLARSAAERAAMGARGRDFVLDGHTWADVFERIHGVYREVARC